MGKLDGKVALVTGGGRGIGRGIAHLMAQEGASVLINDLGASLDGQGVDQGPAATVAREIEASGGKAAANTDSVSDYEAAGDMVQQAVDELGGIDIVVNCAGILRDRMIFNMSYDEWKPVIDVHLKGTFNICKWASIRFREQKSGRIINMSSNSALGAPGQPNYAAAKAGIVGLTLTCANGLARYNVTANAIMPSGWTRMIDSIPRMVEQFKDQGKMPSEIAEGTEKDPKHVAPLATFLATDDAQHINGHFFGSFGYNYVLMSQPKVIKTLRADHRLSVDELIHWLPKAFNPELHEVTSDPGVSTAIEALPEGEWLEIEPGVRYWGSNLEPYGELTW